MGVRKAGREVLCRLESKTLENRFLGIIRQGLGCSPFEAEAVLDSVKEVYYPYLGTGSSMIPPGHISLLCVDAEEPAGKPVKDCQMRDVTLKIHIGKTDDEIIQKEGIAAFRRSRIPFLAQEALSQGALLTREDLAYRVFFVGTRTISRDLNYLRTQKPEIPVPIRSTVQDIGPVLTHRNEIVRLALEGKTTSEICQIMHHSPSSVANYLNVFTRCAYLHSQNLQAGQIAFLLRRGKGLIRQYLELLEMCRSDKNMAYHLNELMRPAAVEPFVQKKTCTGRNA